MLDGLIARAGGASRIAAWIGGAALMAAALVVTVDVLARKFVGWSMAGADELSGYVFAVATSWAFSYAVLQRANVRIDGLYLLSSTPLRAAMDIAALLALSAYVAAMLHSGWVLWWDSYSYGSRSITPWRTPLAVPQALWLLGWAWLALTLALLLLRCLQALLRGDLAGVLRVAGVRTFKEEIDAEVAQAQEELAQQRRLRARTAGE
jgi:TRAP-type C4-dicarboxylate transport system permease small subunit